MVRRRALAGWLFRGWVTCRDLLARGAGVRHSGWARVGPASQPPVFHTAYAGERGRTWRSECSGSGNRAILARWSGGARDVLHALEAWAAAIRGDGPRLERDKQARNLLQRGRSHVCGD